MKWILLLAASVFFFSISAQPLWNSAGWVSLPGIVLAADDDEVEQGSEEIFVDEEDSPGYDRDAGQLDDPDGQDADIYAPGDDGDEGEE